MPLMLQKLAETPIPEPLKTMIINGYNFKRSGAVEVDSKCWLV